MSALIVKTSSLGDIVQTFPVAQYLKLKKMDVHWVVEEEYAELVQAHPCVDLVISAKTQSWRRGREISSFKTFQKALQATDYDVVFDLQGNIKSGLITSLANSKEKVGFTRDCVPEWPNLLFSNRRYSTGQGHNIRVDYLKIVCSWFKDPIFWGVKPVLLRISEDEKQLIQDLLVIDKKKVMVCPGSTWKNKQISPETLLEFLMKIAALKTYYFYFVWGSEEEKRNVERLASHLDDSTVLPKLKLSVLQNFMDKMDKVIAMDSLPLHLAGTTSTSTFGLFGPSSSIKYAPQGEKHHSLQGGCPYGEAFDKRCTLLRTCATGACIRSLTAETLFHTFLSLTK